jgi:hypothetical protein
LTPTRPTFLRSRIEPIPCTTVQKITGAIIILISEMKPSPSGLNATPISGKKWPIKMPTAIASRTWT